MEIPPALIGRFLGEPTLAALHEAWKMHLFLDDNKTRRTIYFKFIEDQMRVFDQAERPLDDRGLRNVVIIHLELDRSYRLFLDGRGVKNGLLEVAPWEQLLTAGAGTILCQYMRDGS